jgi:GH25 family lysozyme M1 (1,4-beta-N-acetylmuramidase)
VGAIPGIDVSHWQGAINWGPVAAAGYKFAVIKCTEGTTIFDAKFAANWAGAKAAGIKVMPYHFFRCNLSGKLQAEWMLSKLQSVGAVPLGIVDDCETTDGATIYQRRDRVAEFKARTTIELGRRDAPRITYTGYYANQSLFQLNSDFPATHGVTPLWMARYDATPWPIAQGFNQLLMWQYTSTGPVPGIPANNVDKNYFYGSEAELAKYFV